MMSDDSATAPESFIDPEEQVFCSCGWQTAWFSHLVRGNCPARRLAAQHVDELTGDHVGHIISGGHNIQVRARDAYLISEALHFTSEHADLP